MLQSLLLLGAAAAAAAPAPLALSMLATPANPSLDSETFTIAWRDVPAPESTDWVASYCVGAEEPAFGPWSYVNVDANWATGSGSMQLVVDRGTGCDTEFRMYRDPSPYALLGASNAVHWNVTGGSVVPRHVRIAYGVAPQTEMTVSWTSDDSSTPAILLVGSSSGNYNLPPVTAAAAVTYAASDSCGAPSGWSFPGYFHHALVTGLTGNTRYYVLPTQNGTRGVETTFVTGKPTGASVATQFAVYGDMWISGGSGAVETAVRMGARVSQMNDLDFVAHVGDLSYAEGTVSTWNTFHSLISNYSGRLPYLVSIGNHEYDYTTAQDGSKDPSGAGKMYAPPFWNGGGDSGGECGMPTSRRFRMPANGNGVFWYSFAVGNVHIAMISSEHNPNPGAPMGDWLAQDLASVDRKQTPWLMVGIHRPIVETEAYPSDFAVAAGLRAILEPLLLKWNVDVVLSGHYHSFQRSCAMANLTCVSSGGIVHYTTGAAGASLDNINLYPSNYIEKTILGTYGYSIVTAPNATALRLQFYANVDNQVQDEKWVYKS